MNKLLKPLVLILSLALVAGLFVFLLGKYPPKVSIEKADSNPKAKSVVDLATEIISIETGPAVKGKDLNPKSKDDETTTQTQLPPGSSQTQTDSSRTQTDSSRTQTDSSRTQTDSSQTQIPAVPKDGWNMENLSNQISQTVKVDSLDNKVLISYAQPDIPKEYHFTFKVEVFDENGKTIDRYVSDSGWISEDSNYRPEEKIETIKMNVPDLNNKMAIISIKVGDEYLAESASVYQLTINYDGSRVWNNAVIKAR